MLNFRHILPFLLFTNCTAPFSEKEIPEREEGAHFYITVENPETKSLNGTIAENWEKKINTAYIYIFQAATGQLLYLHTLNSSNINALNSGTNNTVSFIVPINGSQNCNVYMVANTLLSGSTSTESSFLASIEQDITSYNGKFTRNKGYFITAKVNKLINILSSSPSKVCEIHAFNE